MNDVGRMMVLLLAMLPMAASAQELPMTREGLDSALAQYFAGADRNSDGKLDRKEAADALGFARSMLGGQPESELFTMDKGPDGQPRIALNDKGPLGRSGRADMLFRLTDADGDGALSLAEVQAVGRATFDAVDTDHDGILDDSERAAAKQQIGMLKGLLGR